METESIKDRAFSSVSHSAGKYAVQQAVAGGIGGASAGVGGVFSVAGVSFAAAASVMINQAVYQHRRAELREMYKDEAAVQFGKSPKKITDKDIDLLAKGDQTRGIAGNKTIAEELSQSKKRRNLGMLVSTASILGTLAIVMAISGFIPPEALGAGVYAAKFIAGVAIHELLEKPIHWLGKKIFGMEDTSTHERIAELNKEHRNGKSITKEQVLGVFVSANKELNNFVKEQYAKPYDKLSVQEKRAMVEAVEQYIPLKNITENLNSGRVKISELAFSVEGQRSGVAPDSVPQHLSIIGKARGALHNISERLHHSPAAKKSDSEVIPPPVAVPVSVAPKRAVVEYDNPTPTRSFVERYQAEKSPTTGRTIH